MAMDLLCNAYSTASDVDDEPDHGRTVLPPSKRPKPQNPCPITKPLPVCRPTHNPNLPTETPLPGRYISKRERAVLASAPTTPNLIPPIPVTTSPGVKDVKWSQQGLFLLSCGYDCSSRLIDIEKGLEAQVFKEDQVVHEYRRGLGPILDVEFTTDAKQFISSCDESKGNISENSIIVWDVLRQVPLSNQVYVEAYTCPCIRIHPFDPYFVAQSNGNYIAVFSSKPPFKLDKYRRYESHSVSGFPIKCNFNLDGEKIASGSSDGCIYFYNSKSSELVKKMKAYEQACMDVAFHPVMPNVIASCSWNGDVSVFE
ncbi:unnamed protein product [Ilex paraguariensis]|uniref:Uncharacterized protein n=1 Tax=Ilex paraguariensis TaxID=185542 RepID=A0ABC8U1Y7_9AQUA